METQYGKDNVEMLGSQPARKKSENIEAKAEVPSIRLSPDQIEEIHADEYSLSLFYATRMEPMSLAEIKVQFPEPESKKAESVMERYLKSALVHLTPDGKYYSNYPENYINYSHYRYDAELEARKDAKVFQIMKEQTGKAEFWKNKTYFSMDAFYSEEQSKELLKMFHAIRFKAKEFSNENAKKKSIKNLMFRRMKFFDMTFAILLALFFGFSNNASAVSGAGGNDPHGMMSFASLDRGFRAARSGGNDPSMMAMLDISHSGTDTTGGGGGHDPDQNLNREINECGGGGHDPSCGNAVSACYVSFSGTMMLVTDKRICAMQMRLESFARCTLINGAECSGFTGNAWSRIESSY